MPRGCGSAHSLPSHSLRIPSHGTGAPVKPGHACKGTCFGHNPVWAWTSALVLGWLCGWVQGTYWTSPSLHALTAGMGGRILRPLGWICGVALYRPQNAFTKGSLHSVLILHASCEVSGSIILRKHAFMSFFPTCLFTNGSLRDYILGGF